MSDDLQFDALLGNVAQTVKDDLEANVGVPDLLAVVELAHRLDSSRVSQAAVDEVSTYAPVVSLGQARRLRQSRNDDAFDDIVRDVRGHVDQDVARALGTPPPTAQVSTPQAPSGRKWGVILLAAVALLGIGIGIGTLRGTMLTQAPAEDPSAALLSPQPDDDKSATFKHATPPRRNPAPVAPEPTLEEEPAPPEEPEVDAATASNGSGKRSGKRKQRPVMTETASQKLNRLEREANGAWKAGRHSEAESTYRTIIKLDRRGSWAESAYGDLFTLQRQRGKGVASLWRAYLKRFPKGRFADDASAGLCRRATDADKVACWTAYLEAIPKGSFRQQARREIDQNSPGETP